MGTMPYDPIFIKTIVTSDMAERIAESYGVRTINVLTGFKYIPQATSQLTMLVWLLGDCCEGQISAASFGIFDWGEDWTFGE